MGIVRVLVVEDSETVRRRLCAVLSRDPGIRVIGEASDGKHAIVLCRDLKPDVVTMDMVLPMMSGLASTEYIMAHCPTPILIVSSSTNRGDLFKTYEALAAGAVDVLEKPRGDDSDVAWERRFIATVKLVARIRVITHPRARLGLTSEPRIGRSAPVTSGAGAGAGAATVTATATATPHHGYEIVAIGASTGGPAAIVQLLRSLPKSFSLPLLFVLHIGEPFGGAFADWLDGQSEHRVAFAKDGDLIGASRGRVVMAPPSRHLVVRNGRFQLTRDSERHSCRPSVDVLFESVASEFGPRAAACLLTGMGRDGAEGLHRIHQAGGLTIAQDERTSAVWGMPHEAILLGAVERVLPLEEIGPLLGSLPRAGRQAPP